MPKDTIHVISFLDQFVDHDDSILDELGTNLLLFGSKSHQPHVGQLVLGLLAFSPSIGKCLEHKHQMNFSVSSSLAFLGPDFNPFNN